MLTASVSTARNASRIVRHFATVSDSAGLKVAAVDRGQPTTSVTVLVKAGSRYQSKPGVANALKNFAFKGTAKRSAIGTIRESELYGGLLSATLTREHLALTAEFLRGDEGFFVDVLSSFVNSAKFSRSEYAEYVQPLIESDTAAAQTNPATLALETAHTLAFRTGLGASLFAPAHNDITHEDIQAYAKSAFTKENIVVFGTGIDQSALTQLVEKSFQSTPTSASATSPKSSYFGGENGIHIPGGLQTVFVGFGAAGAPSPELAVLAAHLSPQASIKWSKGTSPIALSAPEHTFVQSVYLPYSDAALLGVLIQARTTHDLRTTGTAAVDVLKKAAGGLSGEEFKKAVAKAKFSAANAVNTRDGLLSALGPQILNGAPTTLENTLASFDKVTASAVTKVASALVKSKPTHVGVGDVGTLPYADELGL